MTESSILPGSMPIKIICKNFGDDFQEKITQIVHHHFPKTGLANWSERESEAGRYISFTVIIYVETEEQLKALNSDLKELPQVIMVI